MPQNVISLFCNATTQLSSRALPRQGGIRKRSKPGTAAGAAAHPGRASGSWQQQNQGGAWNSRRVLTVGVREPQAAPAGIAGFLKPFRWKGTVFPRSLAARVHDPPSHVSPLTCVCPWAPSRPAVTWRWLPQLSRPPRRAPGRPQPPARPRSRAEQPPLVLRSKGFAALQGTGKALCALIYSPWIFAFCVELPQCQRGTKCFWTPTQTVSYIDCKQMF